MMEAACSVASMKMCGAPLTNVRRRQPLLSDARTSSFTGTASWWTSLHYTDGYYHSQLLESVAWEPGGGGRRGSSHPPRVEDLWSKHYSNTRMLQDMSGLMTWKFTGPFTFPLSRIQGWTRICSFIHIFFIIFNNLPPGQNTFRRMCECVGIMDDALDSIVHDGCASHTLCFLIQLYFHNIYTRLRVIKLHHSIVLEEASSARSFKIVEIIFQFINNCV